MVAGQIPNRWLAATGSRVTERNSVVYSDNRRLHGEIRRSEVDADRLDPRAVAVDGEIERGGRRRMGACSVEQILIVGQRDQGTG